MRLEDRVPGPAVDEARRGVLEAEFTLRVDGSGGRASTRAIVFYPEEWQAPLDGLPLLLLGHVRPGHQPSPRACHRPSAAYS